MRGGPGAGNHPRATICNNFHHHKSLIHIFPSSPQIRVRVLSQTKKILVIALVTVALDFSVAQILKLWPNSLPFATDEYWNYQPPLSHQLNPDLDRNALWISSIYRLRTNSLGFKDSRNRDIPEKSDKRRILFLGDSFTEGVGVPYARTFAGIVAAGLGEGSVDVLNGGTFGYSPIMYYRRAKYLLEERHFDIDEIVVMIDLSDIWNELRDYAFDADGNVIRQMPLDWAYRVKRLLKSNFLTIKLADVVKDRFQYRNTVAKIQTRPRIILDSKFSVWTVDKAKYQEYGRDGIELAAKRMSMLAELAKRHGIKLTVGVYPWPDQIMHRDIDSIQVKFWRDWADKRGAGFVNLFPLFINGADPTEVITKNYFQHDFHFNAAGHALVGKYLLQELAGR